MSHSDTQAASNASKGAEEEFTETKLPTSDQTSEARPSVGDVESDQDSAPQRVPHALDLDDGFSDELELLQYKIVVLGDGAVGKSSLLNRLCADDFQSQYKQTLGLDLFKKRIDLPGGVRVSLHIWDIGGQTIGSKMIQNYIYAAQAVLLVYDITNSQSFHNIDEWLAVVTRVFDKSPLPYIALVGNKMDLSHMRMIRPDLHQRFATDNSLASFFVSARMNDMVSAMFRRVAAELAGVALTQADIEASSQSSITARITNYEQHDPSQKSLNLAKATQANSSACTIA